MVAERRRESGRWQVFSARKSLRHRRESGSREGQGAEFEKRREERK